VETSDGHLFTLVKYESEQERPKYRLKAIDSKRIIKDKL
jgi:hypothetical protein